MYRGVVAADPDTTIYFTAHQEAAYRATAARLTRGVVTRLGRGTCSHRLLTPPFTGMVGTGLA